MRTILGQVNNYQNNITVVKRYTEDKYKVTTHNALRIKGLEADFKKPITEHDEKMKESIIRARSKIFELAYCNPWQLFCTFTLDPTKYDRYNLDKFRSDFTQFIRDLRKKYHCDIAYLLIPEHHKDGAWHMHGFISGLPEDELREFTLREKLPKYIHKKLKEGSKVLEWVSYRAKFGYCDLEEIRNPEACAKYVTKYITKELLSSVKELHHKTYYCSQGLQRAVEVKRGHLNGNLKYDFENEYVHVVWATANDIEALDMLEV